MCGQELQLFFHHAITQEDATKNLIERSSLEACSGLVSQDIPRILWRRKFHCRVQGSVLTVFVLDQMNQLHILTPDFLKVHFNIRHILSFLPKYSNLSRHF